jgi:hypothetical protein
MGDEEGCMQCFLFFSQDGNSSHITEIIKTISTASVTVWQDKTPSTSSVKFKGEERGRGRERGLGEMQATGLDTDKCKTLTRDEREHKHKGKMKVR